MTDPDSTPPLPPADHYQYFSHLWHGGELVPWRDYEPSAGWQYPEHDRQRFLRLFHDSDRYVADRHCVDLGCHVGFMSHIARHLGARSVVAVNSRSRPLEVGRFACSQLAVSGVEFRQLGLEDIPALEAVCRGRNTAILAGVLEHLQNPHAVLAAIGRSGVQHLLFQSSLAAETGLPQLTYLVEGTQCPFTAWDGEKAQALAAMPNLLWIETVLYSLGWRVEQHRVDREFNTNWFATPGLDQDRPRTHRIVTLAATRCNGDGDTNRWQ